MSDLRQAVARQEREEMDKAVTMYGNLQQCIDATKDQILYWHKRNYPWWKWSKRKQRQDVRNKLEQLGRLLSRLLTLQAQNEKHLAKAKKLFEV